MPLKSYGVLVGRALDRRREGAPDDTPHYQIQLTDGGGTSYRVAVNVLSQLAPSELLYRADDDFRHPITAGLATLGSGWLPLAPGPGGLNLDYIRGNLFDPTLLRPLPPDVIGPDNDLADILDHYVGRAIADPKARVFAFGERWGPEPTTDDKVFGFNPGNGVHDIHMNQGNTERFRRDDGVWQDGGLLIQFPGESRWVGLFLAFQSQAMHTDDVTGHAIETVGGQTPSGEEAMRIVAALVNPATPDPEAETVTLINASPQALDLAGWRLADERKVSCALPAVELPAGGTITVGLTDGVKLGNRGGQVTLLDVEGLKVHGVSYTAERAQRAGWTIVF